MSTRIGNPQSPVSSKVSTKRPLSGMLLIPAFNEAASLNSVLERVIAAELDLAPIVVDDGSTDKTAKIALDAGVRVVRHPFNLGYGAALQTGYKLADRAGAMAVVQMDADGQHDPRDISSLLEPVERGVADIVIGSRFLGDSTYEMDPVQTFGRVVLKALARVLGMVISDPTSGFQALSRKALALFLADSFPVDYPDLDVLLKAHRHGLRIQEQPVKMSPSQRRSNLHSGVAPIYYLYRMMLSLWAVSNVKKSPGR